MPFGEVRGGSGTWPARLDKGFVGGTLDSTGLTHIGAREYDPSLGRFISVDPVMDTEDPQQWNSYAYSNNSPVTFSDPSGLWCDMCNNGNGWVGVHQAQYESTVNPYGDLTVDAAQIPRDVTYSRDGLNWLFDPEGRPYVNKEWALSPKPGHTPRGCYDEWCGFVRGALTAGMCTFLSGGLGMAPCGALGGAVQEATNSQFTGENPALATSRGIVLGYYFELLLAAVPAIRTPSVPNNGMGKLIPVKAKDPDADALAKRIGGEPSMKFQYDPDGREFDAVSSKYIGQSKPANFRANKAFRDQARKAFIMAQKTSRTPYFQFNGVPHRDTLSVLGRYAREYGIEPVLDFDSVR